MLTLKYKKHIRMAVISIASVLVLFAGSVSAKKAARSSGKSGGGSQKGQQAARSSGGSRVNRSVSSSRTSGKSGARSQASGSQSGFTTSRLAGLSSPGRTVKPGTRQSSRMYSRQPSRVTPGRTTTQRPQVITGVRKSSGSSFRVKRSVEVRPSTGIQATTGSSSVISSGKTLRIVALVGEKETSVTTTERLSGDSKPNTGTAKVTERVSSKVVRKSESIVKQPEKKAGTSRKLVSRTVKADGKTSVVIAGKVSRDSKPGIGTPKTAENTSIKVLKESRTIVKQPEKRARTGRKHISRTIKADGKTSVVTAGKVTRNAKPNLGTAKTGKIRSIKVPSKSETIVKRPEKRVRIGGKGHETNKLTGVRTNNRISFQRSSLLTRISNERNRRVRGGREKGQRTRIESREVLARSRPIISRSRKVIDTRRRQSRGMDRSLKPVYRERTRVVKHPRRHEHVYMDRHNRTRRIIAWPSYHFGLYYNWGPYWTFRYFYPYYHRRYVFVSLGGYWPIGYNYMRYYWYGCHPYSWYGYYPIAREVGGDTYNYYTYNYYDDTAAVGSGQTTYGISAVDHTTFADVREKLAQQAVEEPEEQTLADKYFEDAVKAFEADGYDTAAELFAKAMELAPDDMVLPFAYAQALFAGEKYAEAAEVVRAALTKVSPEKEGVFYPRGLYPEEDVLLEQIDRLAEKAELYGFDGDLQLLLGYHLLGIGETDEAVESLRLANQDLENASSAAVLLSLAEKIRIQNAEDSDE